MLEKAYAKVLLDAGYREVEYEMDDYHAYYYTATLTGHAVDVKVVLPEDEENEYGERNELSVYFREVGKEDWHWQFSF